MEDFGGGLGQEGETGNQVEIESPARRKKPRKSVSFVTDSPVSGGEIKGAKFENDVNITTQTVEVEIH